MWTSITKSLFFFLPRQWVLVHLDETKTSHYNVWVAQGESEKVRLRRSTSAKKATIVAVAYPGQLVQL